jgi:uncharacterized protein (DUF58 family)
VHWRSTAKYGELMVRREEQPLRSRATVLLDTRALGHRGSGPASSFEWAVSAAASISLHLLEHGYAVRLLTDTGDAVTCAGGPGGASAAAAGELLDTLAMVQLSESQTLLRAEEVLRMGGEGLVVALLGSLEDEQLAELSRLRRRTAAALAILLDSRSWSLLRSETAATAPASAPQTDDPTDPEGPQQRLLREAGWTVLSARSGDSLPDLWQQAERSPERSLRSDV